MRALDVVGSKVDSFACPRCGAHDRERHLLMYMRATGVLAKLEGARVLHIAPERRLSGEIEKMKPSVYVRGDLHPKSSNLRRIDVQSIKFDAESFDFAIANHVLEHVENDLKALVEIYRVLKPGGFAILQTPYSATLHNTWEDPGISDPAARLQAYGQADHVRLYGLDIFKRFSSTGLIARVRAHNEVLQDMDAAKTGVNYSEPFFLFERG